MLLQMISALGAQLDRKEEQVQNPAPDFPQSFRSSKGQSFDRMAVLWEYSSGG